MPSLRVTVPSAKPFQSTVDAKFSTIGDAPWVVYLKLHARLAHRTAII
jgi:hypothetical protein